MEDSIGGRSDSWINCQRNAKRVFNQFAGWATNGGVVDATIPAFDDVLEDHVNRNTIYEMLVEYLLKVYKCVTQLSHNSLLISWVGIIGNRPPRSNRRLIGFLALKK